MDKIFRLGFLMLLLSAPAFTESPRVLTVDEAVREALAANPQVTAARARANAAWDSARSARGSMLPGVNVADEELRYTEPFIVGFPLDTPGQPPQPPLEIPARNQNTNTFSVEVSQPLLGLLHLSQDHAASKNLARAADQGVQAAEAAMREQVETSFLRLFEARALAETAQAEQRQLQEQLTTMEVRLKAGVVTTADVLRLKVAVANAQQQEIQAQTQEQATRSMLLATLGLALDDESVDFAPPSSLLDLEAPLPALHEALESAKARRPELASAQFAAQSAQQQAQAQRFKLIPEVSLVGGYVHIQGELLAPADSTFVGFRAHWAPFEGGAEYYAERAAKRREAAAAADEETAIRRVSTEVSVCLSQFAATSGAVKVAEAIIASAEEAYRVTDALVKAGSSTTTDLLDAQSALTQARLNLVRTRYEQAIARIAFLRATGV